MESKGMQPGTLKIILTVIAIIYFIYPRDLLPDAMGWPGRIDDLLLIGFLWWRYREFIKRFVAKQEGRRQDEDKSNRTTQGSATTYNKRLDPYKVLGVPPSASRKEIEGRYRKLVAQYHPDKVNHLGPDLQKAAHQKMLEIQEAYEKIKAAKT